MKESRGEIRFGIHLKQNNLKLVEIETSQAQQFKVNKIIQTDLNTHLNNESLYNDHQIIEIGKQIKDIFNVFNINVKNAVFILESPFALVKKFPIDGNLSESELIDQVDWEVKQFSYSPDDEYIVDFQKLETSEMRATREMVVVSVREKVIKQLRKMFNAGDLSVSIIDMDVFAAARAVEVNYDLKSQEKIALVEIGDKEIKFNIIKDKEFYCNFEISASQTTIKAETFGSADDNDLIRLVSSELIRIVLDFNLGEGIESLNRIFFYGLRITDSMLENFQNNFNVRIDKINPFRRLIFAPKVSVDEKIWAHPETFTVCIGSALR